MSKRPLELTFFADDLKTNLDDRLRRVEGQVRGIARMIHEDKPCPDVLHQLNAATAALHGVTGIILRNYLDNCIAAEIQSGDRQRKQAAIDELMMVLKRFGQ
jgi:CsoR family transcriptional regulator, copper-sensing transcriptional repressor